MSEHQSLLSIASFKSEASIDSLERLVNLDQAKDQSLKLELNQFIGLLQKVKSGNLKSELSVVVSTEQEDYYSFQQKPQDKKDIMYQGFQKCYQEALKTANEKTIEQIEKMNIIYVSILPNGGLIKVNNLQKWKNLSSISNKQLINLQVSQMVLNSH